MGKEFYLNWFMWYMFFNFKSLYDCDYRPGWVMIGLYLCIIYCSFSITNVLYFLIFGTNEDDKEEEEEKYKLASDLNYSSLYKRILMLDKMIEENASIELIKSRYSDIEKVLYDERLLIYDEQFCDLKKQMKRLKKRIKQFEKR